MSDWHLQIWHTDWVLWGYGPNASPIHIEPAEVVVTAPLEDAEPLAIKIPFQLPKAFDEKHPPEEVERRKGWGWRFKTNDLIHDTHWKIAESKEEALAQAAKWAEQAGVFEEAMQDVREMAPLENFLLDILNSV